METEHNSAIGKVMLGLLIGAALGASLGVLFAPDKGSETREKLAEGARDVASDVKKKVKDETYSFRNKAEAFAERADRKATEVMENEGKKLTL